jgi:hypothetical protein
MEVVRPNVRPDGGVRLDLDVLAAGRVIIESPLRVGLGVASRVVEAKELGVVEDGLRRETKDARLRISRAEQSFKRYTKR